MKLIFLTNYCTHHQVPFCNALYAMPGIDFNLAVMRRTDEEQKKLGYKELNKALPYIIRAYESAEQSEKVMRLCESADVVIWGAAPEKYTAERLRQNKLTFIYTERRFKKSPLEAVYPPMAKHMYKKYTLQRKKEQYYLCAGAYVKQDINIFAHTPENFFKWGYFPETKRYADIDGLIDKKEENSIIWVARYIEWKHPELVVEIAKKLKKAGYAFKINMLGNGVLLEEIKDMVKNNSLCNCINVLGEIPSDEVRGYMEKAQIHIFTSDRREGWGAVLNEAMNSACAVVASKSVGAAPYLIENGKNGFIYSGTNDLLDKLKLLLDNPQTRKEISLNAYKTIADEWNAENAAERFLRLTQALMKGEKVDSLFVGGPCSRA